MQRAWPLPALGAWLACWALFAAIGAVGGPPALSLALAATLGIGLSAFAGSTWRRGLVALGFPLSLAASGAAGAVPPWAWLLPLVLLFVVYPVRAWRDAPLFPTPRGALAGLSDLVPLPEGARIVDAGCGLGDGLRELHIEYPRAVLTGWEWSWPVLFGCIGRFRWARIPARLRRTDIWAADWSGFDLVYLFQRPESMQRAVDKALRELKPGAWLASLEFDAPGVSAHKVLTCADGRRVWLYRVPMRKRG